MYYVVPVENLKIETPFKFNGCWITPADNPEEWDTSNYSNHPYPIPDNELNNLAMLYKQYKFDVLLNSSLWNTTLFIFNGNMLSQEQVKQFVENILCPLLLEEIRNGGVYSLPGLPGFTKFKNGYYVISDKIKFLEIEHPGYSPSGIGIEVDSYEIRDCLEDNYFLSNDASEIQKFIVFYQRHAYRSLQCHDPSIGFVQLLTLLDLITGDELLTPKKVRTFISLCISENLESHQKNLKTIEKFQKKRNDIIHNGKSIFDISNFNNIYDEFTEFILFFDHLLSFILRQNVTTFEGLQELTSEKRSRILGQ